MSVSDALVEWRTFYSAVAEAGGTLLGLVFVGITIHLGRHRSTFAPAPLGSARSWRCCIRSWRPW
jgi:hypothetical protein